MRTTKVYVFARQSKQHTVIVGVNAGRSPVRLDLDVHGLMPPGATFRAGWGNTQYRVLEGTVRGLAIPARAGAVWVSEAEAAS
jgi:hypothetical protein